VEAIDMTTTTYPVHVDAHLDPRVSRGLWLVKWILAIPHYVVLAFLWVAFMVMSVVAFFAILFTGRYPRAVFDFNVGVLRWSWRVGYYAYGALGTDQYPPFSLREHPDYPAHLQVDYPEHLSRGLVLVKWWLLAIPHYLVVGILVSGGLTLAGDLDGSQQWVGSTGLISLLVLIAAVALLFTGRYPEPLFDLVLGLNRWVLRVAAYAGLMTDQYPPFRLDQGGHEAGSGCLMMSPAAGTQPSSSQTTPPAPGPAAPAEPTPAGGPPPAQIAPRSGWTGGRVTAAVASSLLLLVSLAMLFGGTVAAVADNALRDDDGYVMGPSELLTTPTYAITSEPLEIDLEDAPEFVPDRLLGRAKLTATSPGGSRIFLGIAPSDDVERYLAGVATDRVSDLEPDPTYVRTDGGPPSSLPDDAEFWRASAVGTDEISITWAVEEGDWTLVAMNADGSREVEADVSAGATLPVLDWVALVLLVLGGIGLIVAVTALALTIRSAGRVRAEPSGPPPAQ
jgi:hypothetical protein